MLDYARLDKEARFYNRQDWQEAAESLGYEFISEAIIKEYTSGSSSLVIAAKMKCSQRAIISRLRKCGVKMKPRGGANYKGDCDSSNDKEIVRLYCEEKLSTREIAKELGIKYWRVYNRLVLLDIPRRSRGRVKK